MTNTTPPPPGTKTSAATSIQRVVVPLVVGFILTQGARYLGLDINNGTEVDLINLIVSGAYYSGIRVLEQKWPKIGILLGKATAPVYPSA